MTNVVHLHGAMHPRNYVRAGRQLSEADLDARIAENRERFAEAVDHFGERLAVRRSLSRPSVIPLDNSLLARAARWLRNLRLKGPRP